MNKEKIFLVNTSVCVEYFRQGTEEIFDLSETLLDEGKVALCGPVEMEILSGLRAKERKQITEILNILPFINLKREKSQLAVKILID